MPPAMLGVAIEPERRGDEQRLADALHKLTAEDPCVRIEHHASLNETVLYGTGEFHMRVLLERMAERYGVPLLGSLPLDAAIREQGDAGTPIVAARPDSPVAAQWRALAARVVAELDKRPRAPAGIDLSLR
jgi:nitrogenase subunit NifH